LISQSRLFSPKVAFSDDFVWNQLHAEAVDALAPSKFFNFHEFLESFRPHLLLTAELVQRIFAHVSAISDSVLRAESFVKLIVDLSIQFQGLHFFNNSQLPEIVKSNRICLLRLMENIVFVPPNASAWFSFPFFVDFLTSLLYETSIRPIVCQMMSKFLICGRTADLPLLTDKLRIVFRRSKQSLLRNGLELFKIDVIPDVLGSP
jgi:hypothetical protein